MIIPDSGELKKRLPCGKIQTGHSEGGLPVSLPEEIMTEVMQMTDAQKSEFRAKKIGFPVIVKAKDGAVPRRFLRFCIAYGED